jgi:hypothetical protein
MRERWSWIVTLRLTALCLTMGGAFSAQTTTD